MTVRINFLPRHYQPPKQLGARDWGIAAATAVAVVAAAAYYSSVYSATGELERRAAGDQAKDQQVKSLLTEASELRGREERVARAESDLKALGGRPWSGVLLNLRELTPQNVTWTGLKVEGNNMTLGGRGRGLLDVAQLFAGLVDHTDIEQVALKYVNEKGIPVTVTATKATDKAQLTQGVTGAAMFRQLEFEMVITLVPAKGRQLPHGA
jgi:Tfp pilus assembly protein PilN